VLNTEITACIDLKDLIEKEQIKTIESLSSAIEALQAELVEDLQNRI
jgi:aerobic-type carbon monoxide dehydrogenase small subunit (CoxS/CutS family)